MYRNEKWRIRRVQWRKKETFEEVFTLDMILIGLKQNTNLREIHFWQNIPPGLALVQWTWVYLVIVTMSLSYFGRLFFFSFFPIFWGMKLGELNI